MHAHIPTFAIADGQAMTVVLILGAHQLIYQTYILSQGQYDQRVVHVRTR